MSVSYILVNRTKRELISFQNLPASSAREIAGYPPAAALTAWYFLTRRGDDMAFVGDDTSEPIADGILNDYKEVTDLVVDELIGCGVLEDRGISWRDPDEPDTVFIRDLRVCWMAP